MAPEPVFFKKLTYTDINHRISFPLEKLGILPPVAHKRDPVEFQVSCGDQVYTFCCIKRSKGPYLKPVIQRGWSKFVRDKGLRVGDFLQFHMEARDHEQPTRYWIEVRRCVSRHHDEMGTAWFWQQIA